MTTNIWNIYDSIESSLNINELKEGKQELINDKPLHSL